MWPPGATLAPRGIRGDCKAGKAKSGSHHSISGFSYRLYVDRTAASPHPSVRRMLENREYHSPWFCLPAAFLHREAVLEMESWKAAAWEGCSLFDHLLSLPYMGEVGASSSPHPDEHPVVLFSTEERYCSCFKCTSCPFSFGHGIQTWGFHHIAFLILPILWAHFSMS